MGSDPLYAKYPNLTLSHHIFVLRSPHLAPSHAASERYLSESITKDQQAPLYRYLYHPAEGILAGKGHPWDEQLYEDLKSKNVAEKEGYGKEMKEAEEKAGETEVTEWMGKIAEFWARVGDKVRLIYSFNLLKVAILFYEDNGRWDCGERECRVGGIWRGLRVISNGGR